MVGNPGLLEDKIIMKRTIPSPLDLAEGSNTYSISFDSLTGVGTGFRADVIVNGDGSLSLGTVRDKGKGYAVGDHLEISTDPTVRGVNMFDAAAEGFRIEVASISNANDEDPKLTQEW